MHMNKPPNDDSNELNEVMNSLKGTNFKYERDGEKVRLEVSEPAIHIKFFNILKGKLENYIESFIKNKRKDN